MEVTKKYRFGFELAGLLLFVAIMLPNLIWMAVPAPNDVLRADSLTPTVDMIGSVFQVMMVALLCLVRRREVRKLRLSPLVIFMGILCLLYFVTWFIYYQGITNPVIHIVLCLAPCMAFGCFILDRKNYLAMVPLAAFTVCHMIYGFVNFGA